MARTLLRFSAYNTCIHRTAILGCFARQRQECCGKMLWTPYMEECQAGAVRRTSWIKCVHQVNSLLYVRRLRSKLSGLQLTAGPGKKQRPVRWSRQQTGGSCIFPSQPSLLLPCSLSIRDLTQTRLIVPKWKSLEYWDGSVVKTACQLLELMIER